MILSRFRWYRRMRGGYWAQVSPLLFKAPIWIRCNSDQPTPDHKWEFYPWASKTLGNCYIDEWYSMEPFWAVPYSSYISKTIGTSDMSEVLNLIKKSKEVLEIYKNSYPSEALLDLEKALVPFEGIK